MRLAPHVLVRVALLFFILPALAEEGDYYRILGISSNATQAEVKAAYRKKALDLHPDRNPGGTAEMQKVNEAYSVLGNEQKRAAYDLNRSAAGTDRAPRTSGGSASSGRDPGDAFQSYRPDSWDISVNSSESIMKTLVSHRGKSQLELVEIAVTLFEKCPPTSLQAILTDILTRSGMSRDFNRGHFEISEAVFKAAFIMIKRMGVGDDSHLGELYRDTVAGLARDARTFPNRTPIVAFAEELEKSHWSDWRSILCRDHL